MKAIIVLILGILFTLTIPYLAITYIIKTLYPSKRMEYADFGDNYMLC